MLSKPDRHQLLAIFKVSRVTDWEGVDRMLREELTKTYESMTDAESLPAVHRLQGRAAFIKELLKLVQDAPELLRKQGVSTL